MGTLPFVGAKHSLEDPIGEGLRGPWRRRRLIAGNGVAPSWWRLLFRLLLRFPPVPRSWRIRPVAAEQGLRTLPRLPMLPGEVRYSGSVPCPHLDDFSFLLLPLSAVRLTAGVVWVDGEEEWSGATVAGVTSVVLLPFLAPLLEEDLVLVLGVLPNALLGPLLAVVVLPLGVVSLQDQRG